MAAASRRLPARARTHIARTDTRPRAPGLPRCGTRGRLPARSLRISGARMCPPGWPRQPLRDPRRPSSTSPCRSSRSKGVACPEATEGIAPAGPQPRKTRGRALRPAPPVFPELDRKFLLERFRLTRDPGFHRTPHAALDLPDHEPGQRTVLDSEHPTVGAERHRRREDPDDLLGDQAYLRDRGVAVRGAVAEGYRPQAEEGRAVGQQ